MGTVWKAEQTAPVRRTVALKLIRPDLDSRRVLARFEAERQALALMDHPNIARVLDAGATDRGRPYFVMELVEGTPITRYCDEQRLTPKERLELFLPVCAAVQHAHQKGIIHRDLKPSNVLVGLYDGKPVPKIIDFGVAKAMGQKLTEQTLFTGFGTVIGTLEYMSPEQAQLDNVDIDTRSDIYSLGVLLYELLTGSTPLQHKRVKEAAMLEVLRLVREEEPPKPSSRLGTTEELPSIAANRNLEPRKLTGLVHGDLDWIVIKCLEKDRNRRYETATGLADDLRHYLGNEPVAARPPSIGYRMGKFASRNRRGLATALAFALLIASGLAIGAAMLWREKNQTQAANVRLKDNLTLAMQTLDEVYMKLVEERMPRDPSRTREDEALLEKALGFYEQFAESNRTDPGVRLEVIRAYHRAAEIRSRLGQTALAKATYLRALAIGDGLMAESPRDADLGLELVLCNGYLGALLDGEGKRQEAQRQYDKALALQKTLTAEDLSQLPERYQWSLGMYHLSTATNFRRRGRLAEAEQHARQALDHFAAVANQRSTGPHFRQAHVSGLANLGTILLYQDKKDEAVALYRKAIEHGTQYVSEGPENPELRHVLGICYRDYPELFEGREAEEGVRHGIKIFKDLLGEYPAVTEYWDELARCEFGLGRTLEKNGDHEGAAAAYRRAIDSFARVVAADPEKIDYQWNKAASHWYLANLLVETPDPRDAAQQFREAIVHYTEVVRNDPENTGVKVALARAHYSLGAFLWEQDQRDAAVAEFRQARTFFEEWTATSPDPTLTHYAWFLISCPDPGFHEPTRAVRLATKGVEVSPSDADCWSALGVAQYRTGDWSAAIDALEKSTRLDVSLDSFNSLFVAMAQWRTGDKVKAREAYDHALREAKNYEGSMVEFRRFRGEAAALLGIDERSDANP
jgi:tetratricopeptide (TPR) repeat protein